MSQMLKREVPRAAQATALLGVGTGDFSIRAIASLGLGIGPSLRSAALLFALRATRCEDH
jgi:hypothetical protein